MDGQRDAETKSGKFCSIEYAFLREHIAVLMKIGFRYTLPASCSILSRSLHLDSQARLFRQHLAVKGDAASWKLPGWYLHRDTISTSFPFLAPLWLYLQFVYVSTMESAVRRFSFWLLAIPWNERFEKKQQKEEFLIRRKTSSTLLFVRFIVGRRTTVNLIIEWVARPTKCSCCLCCWLA